VEQNLKRYLLYTEGSTDGHVAFNDTLGINPKKSILIRKKFPEKIQGIAVGARSEDQRGHSVIKKGGVGQKFVKLKVYAGNNFTEVMVKIVTK